MEEKYFDGRGEKWSGWVERFLEKGWVKRQLESGDFAFLDSQGRRIGIECKSVSDIASRWGDARRQLAMLISQYDVAILLYWGRWYRLKNDTIVGGQNQLTWGHLWNGLLTFKLGGLIDDMALSRDHAFLRVNQIFAYCQKGEHTADLVARRSDSDKRIATLMAIPGISKKIGAALLKEFGSIEGVATASEKGLTVVTLVGGKRAYIIHHFIHSKEPMK